MPGGFRRQSSRRAGTPTRTSGGEGEDEANEPMRGPIGGRITALKPQVRDPERLNLFLDGTFAFSLGEQLAGDEGLRVGDDLTPERVAELRSKDQVGKATTAALNLLARRPRSVREVRDRLRQKGYEADTIDAAVAKLEGWRYVDDTEFARYWVENREAHKPRGKRLLEQELRFKGVDRELVRETIAAAEIDEVSAAIELGRTKLRTYASLEPAVAQRRLGAFLARRGYGYDVIKPTLAELFGDRDGDDSEPE